MSPKKEESVLKKTYPFLNLMYNHRIPKRTRMVILNKTSGNPDLLNSAKEIAVNIKEGNLKLNKSVTKKISKDLKSIIKCKPKQCQHPGKKHRCKTCVHQANLLQKGDGIFSVAIPILASIAASLFANK